MGLEENQDNGQDPQPQQAGQAGRPHWSSSPTGLLIAVLAVKLFQYILSFCTGMLMMLFHDGSEETSIRLAVLSTRLGIIVTLLTAVLFYRYVRARQKHDQAVFEINWKPGIAFWAGIVLVLGYGVWSYYGYAQYQPVGAATNFMILLVNGFTETLFLVLLYPVLERRFGIIRGALVMGASFALLAAVERLIVQTVSALTLPAELTQAVRDTYFSGFLPSILNSAAIALAMAIVRVAAYLSASRRVLGAWLLAVAIPGLLRLLDSVIVNALIDAGTIEARNTMLLVDVPYYLVVLALGLAVLAGFRRWKTLREFGESLRKIQDTD